MYGIIYIAKNKITKKVYIGQTIYSLEIRIKRHYNKKNDTFFHRALKKYKKETFRWRVLCKCFSSKELNAKEIYFIKKYNSTNRKYGYNLKEGGKSGRPNKETLKKLRVSHLGYVPSEEARKKIGDFHRGRKLSPEHVEKVRLANIGRKVTPEQIEKTLKTKRERGITYKGKNNPAYRNDLNVKEIKHFYLKKYMSFKRIQIFYKDKGFLVNWHTIRNRLIEGGVKIRSPKEAVAVFKKYYPEEYNKRMKARGKARRGEKSYQYIKIPSKTLDLIVQLKNDGMSFIKISKKVGYHKAVIVKRLHESGRYRNLWKHGFTIYIPEKNVYQMIDDYESHGSIAELVRKFRYARDVIVVRLNYFSEYKKTG